MNDLGTSRYRLSAALTRTVKNRPPPSATVFFMAQTIEDLLPLLADLSADRTTRRSLAELASSAGVSPSTFQRAFGRLVRESPKQYTRRLQLECAALMLLQSDDSVLDVALRAGFDSHEGFTRAFTAQFEAPPKRFRRQAQAAGLDAAARHLDLLAHVGPCLSLFRVSTKPPPEPQMNYDITQQDLPAQTFLYMAGHCPHADIAATLGKLLPGAFQYAMSNHIALQGPPTAEYVTWGPGMVEMHAGVVVAAGATPTGDVRVKTWPATRAAVTIHTGPYDGLPDAHAALDVYLHQQGLTAGGPPREVYLTDPGEVPNPADWKTQVIWPLA